MPRLKSPIHGRDHLPGHSDPIPGLVVTDLTGIYYNFLNVGPASSWLDIVTTGAETGSLGMHFDASGRDIEFETTSSGKFMIHTNVATFELQNYCDITVDGAIALTAAGDISSTTSSGDIILDGTFSGSGSRILASAIGGISMDGGPGGITLHNLAHGGTPGNVLVELPTSTSFIVQNHSGTPIVTVAENGTITGSFPSGPPSGSAGGALDGSYPNPGIASSVAGNGLSESSDVLSVNVDGSTLEINSDALRIKALGVDNGQIAANAVTEAKISLTAASTTNDVTTTKHGFVPIAPNDTAKWLRGDGTWNAISSLPSGAAAMATDAIWDTKGDLAAATGADAAVKVAVGTQGQFLVADTAATPGIRWATQDGWVDASLDTWVFASASTFTIAGADRTAIYTPGTFLKFTQSTVKYATVVSSAFSTNTTVTIAVNTDYTIANAAISANFYSYVANPAGWPDWFNYAPAPTGFQATPTGTARYRTSGRHCFVQFSITGTSNNAACGFTVPFTLGGSAVNQFHVIRITDNGAIPASPGGLDISGASAAIRKTLTASNGFSTSGTKAAVGLVSYEF